MNNQQFSASHPMQPLSAANNSVHSYGSPYEEPYTSPYTQASPNSYAQNKVKNETPMTKSMKSHFSFFGLASAVYAVFYAFCLYKNASGITYPFFVAGTLCYFFLSMKKLGVPFKKGSIFYVISIMLLGISNCCTVSPQLLILNKLGIFLLSFVLMLHTIYRDNSDIIQNENDRRIYYYYKKIYNASEDMHIRSFNFSIFFAGKSAGVF